MTSYWLIKLLLVTALLVVAFFMLRPVKSASHLALRRIGVILIVILAGFSVIFADLINPIARAIGVDSGVNLLVYFLVLTVFTQMATSYRRDSANERKISALTRAIALEAAPKPPEMSSTASNVDLEENNVEVETQAPSDSFQIESEDESNPDHNFSL